MASPMSAGGRRGAQGPSDAQGPRDAHDPSDARGPGGVEELRAAVDQVDRELQRLVARRRELSNRIQALRVGRGGERYDATREEQVVASYVAALGPEGADLAGAVLRVCRGQAGHGPDSDSDSDSG
jgi:chorismate mutase